MPMSHKPHTLHSKGLPDDLSQGMEQARLLRQRRHAPETEEDLLALQDEFYKGTDHTAATAIRVTKPPPIVATSASKPSIHSHTSTRATSEDKDSGSDDDDIPPPLEKDVVSLGNTELPVHPPNIETAPPTSKLRPGSRFLQERSSKGSRTHFPGGERFEIDLDADAEQQHTNDIPVESEEETRKRLNNVGASMGQILHEVLEKPVAEAIAPTGPTTTPGSMSLGSSAGKGAAKGKSLFAQRLAQAQGKKPVAASVNTTSLLTQDDIPSSPGYVALSSSSSSSSKNVSPSPYTSTALPVKSMHRATKSASSVSFSGDKLLPPKPSIPLHSVLKKPVGDTPQSVLMEQIDEENRQKLASMSKEDIDESRAELMRNLDPALIQKLMNRRNVPRRVSFSEGIKIEDKIVSASAQESGIGRDHSLFESKRHEEEEGDHPLALKKKFYEDLPAEPEKLEWMGIEGVSDLSIKSPGKSVAPGPQPYSVQESDPASAHLRFDFAGKIIRDQEDTPVHYGLHHHGADPTKAGYTLSELLHLIRSTVPSQRIIPLNVVAKVLHHCRDPSYASFEVRSAILRWVVDSLRAPVYLRAALDDKTDSGLVAAINAIHAWAVPQSKETADHQDVWEILELLNRGYERINLGFKYQSITKFANMELKSDSIQASQEQGAETEDTIAAHAILASKDPVDGLLAMNVLPRLRYILDVCHLPAHTNNQALDLLLTLVHRNATGAKKVFECEGLLSALVRRYVAIPWPSDKSDIELSCTVKVIKLLDLVVRSSKKYASAVIEEALLDPLHRFLVATPEATAVNKEGYQVQIQVLKLFRSLSAYGLYCNILGDILHGVLLRDIAQGCLDQNKTEIDPVTKSFLSKKLAVCFQLATTWTHAAGDPHRTVPEHALCWAQAIAFLDLALDGIAQWKKVEQMATWDVNHVVLVSAAVRYVSTWARYLSTNPPDDATILDRVWETLQLNQWTKSNEFKLVHSELTTCLGQVPELAEIPLPHLGISMSNPCQLADISISILNVSVCSEYLSSHLTTMFYLARLLNAPSYILTETVDTLVSQSIFGLVEQVTKYELAIQHLIPATLPSWVAFICRHGVYFVGHWLWAMDLLVYQQHPESSSHIKLTFFPLFQVTALSLLQIVLPGDESLSHDVLRKILFNTRFLGKLLSQNTTQIKVVQRILEPLYLQLFIKSDHHLAQSKSLLSHDGRGIRSLVVDYGAISGQPLFNWLFHPIEILYKSKLTYVEESGTLIAATSVVHCTLDFVYSLLQTLDGISFELVYMAALKVLALEGEKEPGCIQEYSDDDESELVDGATFDKNDNGDADQDEDEEDGFMDQEVEVAINRLLDHFSTRGDSLLVRDETQDISPLSEKTLSQLTNPLPFYQFLKNFLENSFTTGALLQYQATAARLLFPAMAISQELKLLIWAESFNFLTSVTTNWQELDSGTLKSLIHDDQAVSAEVLKHYLKAVVSGRVIKQRNPVLYWIAVHHLARAAFAPLKIKLPAGAGRSVMHKDSSAKEEEESPSAKEERHAIARTIVAGTKYEELVRDWVQYDARNYDRCASTVASDVGQPTPGALSASSSSPSIFSPTAASASTTAPIVKSPSRPLSLLSASTSFPIIGSSDYLNSDNILTPPECFRERRQLIVSARKEWLRGVVGEKGLERVEEAIFAGAAHRP
ncbi:RNA polymerase II associated protein 1 [Podila humilis]|nr:RNA polymerase II associated protein 1 [Podila humilis]